MHFLKQPTAIADWYLVKIVYRIICGTGQHTAQFDEQLRLIQAPNRQKAVEKAEKLGRSEETTFYNHEEQLVRWEFINVTDIYRVSPQIDGAEVYSRIEEREPADYYIQILQSKARSLFGQITKEQLTG